MVCGLLRDSVVLQRVMYPLHSCHENVRMVDGSQEKLHYNDLFSTMVHIQANRFNAYFILCIIVMK